MLPATSVLLLGSWKRGLLAGWRQPTAAACERVAATYRWCFQAISQYKESAVGAGRGADTTLDRGEAIWLCPALRAYMQAYPRSQALQGAQNLPPSPLPGYRLLRRTVRNVCARLGGRVLRLLPSLCASLCGCAHPKAPRPCQLPANRRNHLHQSNCTSRSLRRCRRWLRGRLARAARRTKTRQGG